MEGMDCRAADDELRQIDSAEENGEQQRPGKARARGPGRAESAGQAAGPCGAEERGESGKRRTYRLSNRNEEKKTEKTAENDTAPERADVCAHVRAVGMRHSAAGAGGNEKKRKEKACDFFFSFSVYNAALARPAGPQPRCTASSWSSPSCGRGGTRERGALESFLTFLRFRNSSCFRRPRAPLWL